MRGLAIFVVFFAIFAVSSLLIPSPVFPGNLICFLLGISEWSQLSLLSAIVNGIFYGICIWIVFKLSFRWVERAPSKDKLVEKQT
jgi:uncharacterized BrkB/YihY/UPF0761 family membrane protein